MVLRKQTVWLLTMLAVMVVLSGYYLVKGPDEQVTAPAEEQTEPLSGVQVETKQTDQPAPDVTPVKGENKESGAPDANQAPSANDNVPVSDTASDIFQGYKMKREALLQQQKDEQLAIMGNSEATPQAVAEAKAKYEELSNLENATLTVEEMLKASGYKDAVVSVQNDKVMVIVQKDKLEANEAVEIIAQVKQHLNVPGKNITVQFKHS
jgi:stage III sporulation protein AH